MRITTDSLTIEQLLNDKRLYTVPLFQREYAWGNNEIDDFWVDLQNLISRKGPNDHFLGAMVFAPDENNKIKILDGQQRFATIILFLAALREVLKISTFTRATEWATAINTLISTSDIPSLKKYPKIELNRQDRIHFNKLVIDCTEIKPEKNSHKLIISAYKFFYGKIEYQIKINKDIFVEDVLEALFKKMIIIKIDVDSDSNAHMVFETLNDRGLDLSVSDLIKNYVLSLSADDNAKLETNMSLWKSVVDQIGDLNLTRFLRYYWISNYEFARKDDLYKKIKNRIKNSNVDEILSDIARQAQIYSNLSEPTHEFWNDYEIEGILTKLNTLRAEQVYALLLALSCEYKEFPGKLRETILLLTNFTFRYSTICGLNPNDLEPLYSDLSIAIRQGTIDLNELTKRIRLKAPNPETFVAAFKSKEIKDAKLAKYILLEINNNQILLDGEREKLVNARAINLEHIIPKNPDSDWISFFKTKEQSCEQLIHRIGNMTILLEEYNRKIANKYFSIKKEMYSKSSLPTNQKLLDLIEFSEVEVEKRQGEYALIAEKIWNV